MGKLTKNVGKVKSRRNFGKIETDGDFGKVKINVHNVPATATNKDFLGISNLTMESTFQGSDLRNPHLKRRQMPLMKTFPQFYHLHL